HLPDLPPGRVSARLQQERIPLGPDERRRGRRPLAARRAARRAALDLLPGVGRPELCAGRVRLRADAPAGRSRPGERAGEVLSAAGRATGASRAARGLLLLLVLALEQRAVAPVALRLQLAHRDEAQARAVDAVAQPGRRRTVLEHVAEVAVAVLATHLGARHVPLVVRAFDDVARLQRTPAARPAAA